MVPDLNMNSHIIFNLLFHVRLLRGFVVDTLYRWTHWIERLMVSVQSLPTKRKKESEIVAITSRRFWDLSLLHCSSPWIYLYFLYDFGYRDGLIISTLHTHPPTKKKGEEEKKLLLLEGDLELCIVISFYCVIMLQITCNGYI